MVYTVYFVIVGMLHVVTRALLCASDWLLVCCNVAWVFCAVARALPYGFQGGVCSGWLPGCYHMVYKVYFVAGVMLCSFYEMTMKLSVKVHVF